MNVRKDEFKLEKIKRDYDPSVAFFLKKKKKDNEKGLFVNGQLVLFIYIYNY